MRSLSAFDHVRHQRHGLSQQRADAAEVVALPRRLDEQHVGARLAIERGTRKRAVEALDRNRIGAGDNECFARLPGIDSGLDLPRHLLRGDQRLVVEMTAALGKVLILKLDRVGACTLEQTDGTFDVECVAVAGVGIHNQMGADAVAD